MDAVEEGRVMCVLQTPLCWGTDSPSRLTFSHWRSVLNDYSSQKVSSDWCTVVLGCLGDLHCILIWG